MITLKSPSSQRPGKSRILSHLKPGDDVNLEVDVIAKYVEKLVAYKA